MAFESFKENGRPTVQAALDDLPDRGKVLLQKGLQAIARLRRDKWEKLVSMALEALVSSYGFDAEQVAEALEIGAPDANIVGNGGTFIVTMIGAYADCEPEMLVELLVDKQLVSPEDVPKVTEFVKFVADRRGSVEDEAARFELVASVLPTLQRFETSVDLRFSDRSGKPLVAPVVIAMIDSDAEGQIMWFQMSKTQVRTVLEQLQDSLEEIERAEAWANAPRQL